VGWILTGFGYVPNVEQTPTALTGIRLFFGLIPAGIIFLTLPLLFKYPVTRKSHSEVRVRLDALDAASQTKDEAPVQIL
jgi:GPH family glycoside/pentoside/hexuronide:cation symporter